MAVITNWLRASLARTIKYRRSSSAWGLIVCDPTMFAQRSRIWRLVLPFLMISLAGEAAEARRPPAPSLSCNEAIAAAAQANRVPHHLMAAIGLVEAGRQ